MVEAFVVLLFLVLALAGAEVGTDSRDADPDRRVAWWPGRPGVTRTR